MRWFSRLLAGDRTWRVACLVAVVFLAGHLPFLASTLEDIDSINFALGVRDFDPTQHRPHPPGYPIYIALAKLARFVLSEPHALAIWPALFGALAVFPLLRLFQCLDGLDVGARTHPARPWPPWLSPALLATTVTVTAPLFWMTALRPLSDTVGLSVALCAQALLATALVRQSRDVPDARRQYDPAVAARSGQLILMGAFVAALAMGVRSQAMWLTVPLLVAVLFSRTGRGAAGAAIGASVWLAAGALAWFVPLVVASGGLAPYFAALSAQTMEDWTGVDLLATNPSIRRLAFGLYDTLIPHWAGLGWIVLALALVGAIAMLWQARRGFVLLLVAFVPYGVLHVVFQESSTTRYALPLLPPVVYLAVRGAWLLGRPSAVATALLFAFVSLAQVVPAAVAYSSEGSPVSRAVADIRAEGRRLGFAVLGQHFAFARAIEASLDTAAVQVLPTQPKLAALGLAQYITQNGRGPLWFLSDPTRTDLALIDPAGRALRGSYRWSFRSSTFLGFVRPGGADWIECRSPGWVATEGWHLTPETAGIAVATGSGLGAGPITAFVRTRPGAARVMIGGRHLGRSGEPDLVFTLRIDGRVIDMWAVSAAAAFFLRFADLPAGGLAGSAPWVRLTIEARRADTGQYSGQGAIEQFDLQDDGTVMAGYDAGWHERELDPSTGVLWRWTSSRAELRVQPVTRDVLLQVAGESPMRQFVRPSRVVIRAGDRELLKTGAAADFAWSVRVPAAALEASRGIVTIETDQVFRPADRLKNADRRPLGLRVFSVTVTPAS